MRKKHTSKFYGLCSTKSSSETLQNLPKKFIYTVFILYYLYFIVKHELKNKKVTEFLHIKKYGKHFTEMFRPAQNFEIGRNEIAK